MALVTAEVTWLQWLLVDFGVSVSMSTHLLFDSIWAISITRDTVKHELTKHIGVDAHFTRSQIQDGIVAFQYVPLELQLTDFFTKAQNRANNQFSHPNSVLLIHHEFEGGSIRYVLAFSIIVFLQRVICIFSPSCTCIYSGIRPSEEYKCYS
jgi:hypothetical protein